MEKNKKLEDIEMTLREQFLEEIRKGIVEREEKTLVEERKIVDELLEEAKKKYIATASINKPFSLVIEDMNLSEITVQYYQGPTKGFTVTNYSDNTGVTPRKFVVIS